MEKQIKQSMWDISSKNYTPIIVFKDGKDMKKTYHADLLKEGLAKLNRNNDLPEYMKDLDPIEQDAELQEIGVWDDNEETDYGQNEDEY